MITSPIYTLSAHMFDYAEGTMTADVAALDVPDDYDSNRYHFYCSACARQDHFTRLKHVEEQGEPKVNFEAPRRFNLFNRKDSVHICDDHNRFREVDDLAYRYNAKVVDSHRYIFADELSVHQPPVTIDDEIKTVDCAHRLAAIASHLMYDQSFMAQQQIRQNGVTQSFRRHFFDASKTDKEAIFRQALVETISGQALRAAVVFQLNTSRDQWERYEQQRCIPTNGGPHVKIGTAKFQVFNMLWCDNDNIYHHVRRTAFRDKALTAKPLMITGDVQTNLRNFEIAKEKSSKSGNTETVFSVIRVRDAMQVAAWDYDIRFEDAAVNQNKIQLDRVAAMRQATEQAQQNRQQVFTL